MVNPPLYLKKSKTLAITTYYTYVNIYFSNWLVAQISYLYKASFQWGRKGDLSNQYRVLEMWVFLLGKANFRVASSRIFVRVAKHPLNRQNKGGVMEGRVPSGFDVNSRSGLDGSFRKPHSPPIPWNMHTSLQRGKPEANELKIVPINKCVMTSQMIRASAY